MRNITKWTPEMDAFLIANYENTGNKELVKKMGVKESTIVYRATFLQLKKSGETRSICAGRIELTPEMEKYIRDNYQELTNTQIAKGLGLTVTVTRNFVYAMGLKRMEMEYWTEEMVQFLKDNFQHTGDVELTEIFQHTWPKKKAWTKKHIEKKRRYLNLKRTAEQLSAIHDRNVEMGRFTHCNVARWLKYGVSKDGDIRMWRCHNGRYVPFVKVDGKFIHWARHTWEREVGPIEPGMNIVFKDDNPANYIAGIANLEKISDGDLSRRNSIKSSQGLSDNYIAGMLTNGNPELRKSIKDYPELLELKRQELLLNRTIKKQENGRITK